MKQILLFALLLCSLFSSAQTNPEFPSVFDRTIYNAQRSNSLPGYALMYGPDSMLISVPIDSLIDAALIDSLGFGTKKALSDTAQSIRNDFPTQLTEEEVEDFVGGMLTGTQTLISVTYDDPNGEIDFVVEDDLSQYDNSTSGFITDYTVTESDVTQHEGAINITESQISDLGDYATNQTVIDTAAAIRSDFPEEVDTTSLSDRIDVNQQAIIDTANSLSNKDIADAYILSDSLIVKLNNGDSINAGEVGGSGGSVDLSDYYTQTQVDSIVDGLGGAFNYTPDTFNCVNAEVTTFGTNYSQVGGLVDVFGKIRIKTDSSGYFEFSTNYPVLSFTSVDRDASGNGFLDSIRFHVEADDSLYRAKFKGTADGDVDKEVFFDYSYIVRSQPPKLLDLYPTNGGGFSLRQISSSITNVARVRRSSDNLEKDVSEQFITDSIVDWVGTGNIGYVVTMYDQSPQGYHATQSNSSKQPLIVRGDSLITQGGKPTVCFPTTRGAGLTHTVVNSPAKSYFLVSYIESGTGLNIFQDSYFDGSNENGGCTFEERSNGDLRFNTFNNGFPRIDVSMSSLNDYSLFSLFSNPSNGSNFFVNSQNEGSGAGFHIYSKSLSNQNNKLYRLGSGGQPNKEYFISELIIYNSDKNSVRGLIEDNINFHFQLF